MAIDGLDMPARGLEAAALVGGGGEARGAVDADSVVVPEHDQFAQLEVAGQVDRLLADPLHQAAVTNEDEGAVIDQFPAEPFAQHALAQGEADGGGDPLAKRPGGCLDAERVPVFGMPRRPRAELAERLDLKSMPMSE